jgi:hypothetical protein
MINYHKKLSLPLLVLDTQNKVHRNISPKNKRRRRGMYKPCGFNGDLAFLTCGASSHKPLHISSHLRPKEICGQHLLYLLGIKISHQLLPAKKR